MMRLRDWNESVRIANGIAERFKFEGVDVRVAPYTTYDGKKGINLQMFDANGKFYREVPSGIHEDLQGMKEALTTAAIRIAEYA